MIAFHGFYEVIVITILVFVFGMLGYSIYFHHASTGFDSIYRNKLFLYMINDGPDLSKDVPDLKSEFTYFKYHNDIYIEE
jgi:hypothetical protein